MITIISGTNRKDSMSLRVANIYARLLRDLGADVKVLSLENVQVWTRGEEMIFIEKNFLLAADKYIFVMPEYNASFPGILKCMIDNSDVRNVWWNKKALLAGISDGRAGNLRGLEHMTAILHYLKVTVWHNKLILSKIKEEVSLGGEILKPETESLILQQIKEFLSF